MPLAEAEEAVMVALLAATAPLTDTEKWQAFDAKARRQETGYQSAAIAQFRRERTDVAQRVLDAVPAAKAVDPQDPHPSVADPYIEAAMLKIAADYAPHGTYHTEWLERYRALIARSVAVGARGVPARTGLSFTLQNPRARAAVQRRVTKLAGQVTQTTLQRIRDVITQARDEGVGVTEVARRIREQAFSGELTLSRARTIARTETVGALNEGSWEAAHNGVMQSKRWLSQRDGRVRDDHIAADEEGWLTLGDTFANGLRYPHEPGAPADQVIQCRCTLLYSDQSPNEANRT